jgi:leucyl/phenylalanyl-tRNA--protein transferase
MLEPEMLLAAYRSGVFPMAVNDRGDIGWFSPDPRAVLPLDDRFHVPHGLRRVLRHRCDPPLLDGSGSDSTKEPKFEVVTDRDFETVMRECARRTEGTWISEEIVRSYCRLHELGHAHSVETRLGGKLVGGLYGVHIGGAFFGESMFHRTTDASKVALVALVKRLRARGFLLLDPQWTTPHLAQFGVCEVSRREYLRLLRAAVTVKCDF